MEKFLIAAIFIFFFPFNAQGQGARDAEIFGAPEAAKPEDSASTPALSPGIRDSLQIGGRLEMRLSGAKEESESFSKGGFGQLKQADLYFDSRPNQDVRAFLRARFSESAPAAVPAVVNQEIDELWFKWDINDRAFLTFGKQHLKWGSSRIWNPTDFTARETRDPFALFDRRLGQEMLKIHVPNESRGFNYYALLLFDDTTTRNDDVGMALRGEFAFLGQGELALSFQARRAAPLRFGADVSSALGPVDVNLETAFTTREQRTFYDGDLDPASGRFPRGFQDGEKTFSQVTAGIRKSWNYSDEDSVTVGTEYFCNELGYEDRNLELYALAMGQSKSLYAGREYAGLFVLVPQPGSWNKTTLLMNGLQNVSDQTAVLRVTGTLEIFREATLELFASRCFGDYGEFCFRIPDSISQLGTSPELTPEQQAIIQSLPSKRTTFNAGVGISMNF